LLGTPPYWVEQLGEALDLPDLWEKIEGLL
jgi:hypothetical protein